MAITTIVIVGVHFRYTNMDWTNYGFGALGASELSSILLVFVVIIICFIAVATLNSCLLIVSLILLLLSFLFTLAMAIFIFIGTQVRYWNEYVGCDTNYEGLYRAWSSVDVYIQAVDEIFCSDRCPCYFNRTTHYKFLQNTTIAPYLTQWTFSNNSDSPIRFQDCEKQAVADAYNRYLMRNSYYNHTLNPKKFHKYYSHVESFFKCTGFCGTTYFNRETGTNGKVAKYLFSDVTKGVPDYIGCLEPMLKWLQRTMNAYGALCLVLFVLQLILFIIVIMLLMYAIGGETEKEEAREKTEEEEKPQEQPRIETKEERRPEKREPEKRGSERREPERRQMGVPDQEEPPSEIIDTSFRPDNSQIAENHIEFLPSNFNQ